MINWNRLISSWKSLILFNPDTEVTRFFAFRVCVGVGVGVSAYRCRTIG